MPCLTTFEQKHTSTRNTANQQLSDLEATVSNLKDEEEVRIDKKTALEHHAQTRKQTQDRHCQRDRTVGRDLACSVSSMAPQGVIPEYGARSKSCAQLAVSFLKEAYLKENPTFFIMNRGSDGNMGRFSSSKGRLFSSREESLKLFWGNNRIYFLSGWPVQKLDMIALKMLDSIINFILALLLHNLPTVESNITSSPI